MARPGCLVEGGLFTFSWSKLRKKGHAVGLTVRNTVDLSEISIQLARYDDAMETMATAQALSVDELSACFIRRSLWYGDSQSSTRYRESVILVDYSAVLPGQDRIICGSHDAGRASFALSPRNLPFYILYLCDSRLGAAAHALHSFSS